MPMFSRLCLCKKRGCCGQRGGWTSPPPMLDASKLCIFSQNLPEPAILYPKKPMDAPANYLV
jgi:hypothetical protein